MKSETEADFLKNYDLRDYPAQAVVTDLAIFTIHEDRLAVLLIQRGGHPEKGKWALPGGFVENSESIDAAAARELKEETGLTIEDAYLEQLKTYAYPGRDPRGYIVSVSYVALAPNVSNPRAGDDAAEAKFFPVDEVLSGDFDLAFDHDQIVRDGLERVRAKLEYSPIAVHFLEEEKFTLSELQQVYEKVWGRSILHPTNFRRKLTAAEDFLIPTGEKRTSNVLGGRTSDTFKAGPAKTIFPPFRRSIDG